MVDDRLDPQCAVVGAMLIDQRVIGTCVNKLDDQDFTSQNCRIVFQTIRRLWASGSAIDPVIVRDNLTGFSGATGFLVELMDITPTCQNIDKYIDAVKKQSAISEIRKIGEMLQMVETAEEIAELLAKANAVTIRKKERRRMSADEMLRSFAEDHASDAEPNYFPWAYRKLYEKMYAEPGDVVIIAGRPSDGKTAFALINAWDQAKSHRVCFYSLETGAKKIRDRSMAQMLGIDMGHIKRNRITDAEWEAYGEKSGSIASRSFDVLEAAGMTVDEIFADAVSNRYEIIYIDYMQIVKASNPKEFNRTQVVTDISIRIHQHSRSTGIMTVALAQINRSIMEGTKARQPQLSDLKESGQIEQDADAVMFIWREDPEKNDADRRLFVAKNKEGRIGSFDLAMEGKFQRFAEIVDGRAEPPKGRSAKALPGGDYQQITMEDPNLPF